MPVGYRPQWRVLSEFVKTYATLTSFHLISDPGTPGFLNTLYLATRDNYQMFAVAGRKLPTKWYEVKLLAAASCGMMGCGILPHSSSREADIYRKYDDWK
jgi:hypothetical protein